MNVFFFICVCVTTIFHIDEYMHIFVCEITFKTFSRACANVPLFALLFRASLTISVNVYEKRLCI